MLNIDIYGYAAEEICAGSCHEGEGDCSACKPAEKRNTADLVADFTSLLEESEYRGQARVLFHEADASIQASVPEIYGLLNAAQLSPATAVNGKVLYLGGFSPAGLLAELRKKFPVS